MIECLIIVHLIICNSIYIKYSTWKGNNNSISGFHINNKTSKIISIRRCSIAFLFKNPIKRRHIQGKFFLRFCIREITPAYRNKLMSL